METLLKTSNRRIIILLHMAFWLVLGVANLVLFNWFVSTQLLLVRTLVNLAFLAAIFYINSYVLVNRFFEKKKYLLFFLLANALVFIFVPLRVKVNMLLPAIPQRDLFEATQEKSFVVAAIMTSVGIVLFSTLYQVLVNRSANERHALAVINRQNEAQLQFLRAQINPHFLFNTLNNIYSLAVLRSEQTAPMVLKLSQLLRYVIYDGKEEMVTLEREAAHIEQFIELFQMRSERPRDIHFTKEGPWNGLKIEPMILIPLVENCFKHCDFETNENASAQIELKVEGNRLNFRTQNTKNDADRQKDQTGGVGLENILKRLELKHPRAFLFLTNDYGTSFEVFFSIKLSTAP